MEPGALWLEMKICLKKGNGVERSLVAWETSGLMALVRVWGSLDLGKGRGLPHHPAVLPNDWEDSSNGRGTLPRRQGEAVLRWGLWAQLPCGGGGARPIQVRKGEGSPQLPWPCSGGRVCGMGAAPGPGATAPWG